MPCLGIYACALTVTLTYCRVTWNVHAGYACINTFMSIACNGLKELIDYVHVDEDRVIGSGRMQSYKTVHVEKEGPLSIGYKFFNQPPVF